MAFVVLLFKFVEFRVALEGKGCSLAGEGRALGAQEHGGIVEMKLDLLSCRDTAL